jgi:hypothetical protein
LEFSFFFSFLILSLASSFGEEEKMAEQQQTAPAWETSKENVVPLKQGRKVAAIEENANVVGKKDERNEKVEREKRCVCVYLPFFLYLLRGEFALFTLLKDFRETDFSMNIFSFLFFVVINRAHLNEIANYDGDDPLEVWLRCAFSFSLFFIFKIFSCSRGRAFALSRNGENFVTLCAHILLSLSFSL